MVLVSDAKIANSFSTQLLSPKLGRRYIGIQNHDKHEPIVVTIGGADATFSPPNGILIKGEEYKSMRGNLIGEVTIITESENNIEITVVHN